MTNLQQLALRIEGAEGPPRELDAEIAKAVGLPDKMWVDGGYCEPGYWAGGKARPFTASLDAALSLAKDFSEAQLWRLWNEALCRCSKAEASLRDDLPRFLAAAALRAIDKENCDG